MRLHDETGRGRWASGTFDYPGAFAVFQRDGSFGVYWRGQTLFSTGTGGRGAYLALRRDGNLVIYDYNNNPIWAVFPP